MGADRFFSDRRKSFRCSVADSRQQCSLQIDGGELPAWLLEESTDGFSVLVDRQPDLSVGQTVELHTDSGWFDVRVIHVAEAAPLSSGGAASPWFRVGLRRLGEIVLPDESLALRIAGSLCSHLSQGRPSNGILTAFGVFLALAAVVIPLWLAGVSWHVRPSETQIATPEGNVQELGRFVPHSRENVQDMIRRLPGATALVLPEVVRSLQLTKDQQEQIRRIVDAAGAAMHRFDLIAQLEGQQREQITQRRAELLDETRRQALQLLTDQQRAQWEKLIGEPPPDE